MTDDDVRSAMNLLGAIAAHHEGFTLSDFTRDLLDSAADTLSWLRRQDDFRAALPNIDADPHRPL